MEQILQQTAQLEKEYAWTRAAESCEKMLNLLPENDFSGKGQIHERLGHALFRAGFQTENNEQFKNKLRLSIANYEKAAAFYGRSNGPIDAAKTSRCNAMIAYAGYWLGSEKSGEKRLIDECWRQASKALKALEIAGESLEYGKTFNQFSRSADLCFSLEWNWQIREKVIREAARCAEQAIKALSSIDNKEELAKAYVKTADYLEALGYVYLGREDQERQFEKARTYWQKAKEISEEIATLESLSILQGLMLEFGAGSEDALRFYEKALEYGKKTADSFIVGNAFDMMAYHTNHKAWSITEDPDEMIKLAERGLQYAAEAKKQYSKISFVGPGDYGFLWAEVPYPEYYCLRAMKETDLSRKQDLVKKATEAAPELFQRAEDSGYPDAVWYAHHVMGKILVLSAGIETNPQAKRELLQAALQHREQVFRATKEAAPSMYWERGIALVGISTVKSQLADLTDDFETKKKMLSEAIRDGQESFKLLSTGIVSFEKEDSMITILGYTQYQCALLLNRMHDLTHDNEYLTRAAEAFKEAAEYYERFGLAGRVAECHWKIAQAYNARNEYSKASEDFELASESYRKASDKIPSLQAFYQDYALYMQAWSEIEKARYFHERVQYDKAKEYFEKAASLHSNLKRWKYLESNYSAWAHFEYAEELSGKEQNQEAIKAFQRAAELFIDTKKSLQMQLNKIEDYDEKHMATSIVKASDLREKYCDARIDVEQAKILDKEGDHFDSSRKYEAAAEMFERIYQTIESEQERKEFSSIISLSRAWQKMMLGDAKASPELYLEASVLFEKASRESNSELASLLALGHSRFCKALEAGTGFADTGNAALQTVAMQNLEAAAKYYTKAGFQSASEYVKATGLLFDAYAQIDAAKEEKDPEKKTKLYFIAEKILQTSAGSFMKAEHPEKREQVLRLLEKVREEKEMALSIAEVLHSSSIVSTIASFSVPTSKSEEAVGSDRFEHADIQVNLTISQKELKIGGNLEIELELVNAGKGSALLTKVTDINPRGFLIVEKPETCRVEENSINLKGKRLDPLKSEEIKLVLKPTQQGTFSFKPTVLYLDENGKYKSQEPEPVVVVVKELGIKNWLKGER